MDYTSLLNSMANIKNSPDKYLNTFMGAYNTANQSNPYTGVGMGMYNPGSAGMGQYNLGNAGLGQYNISNAGTGQFNIDPSVGTGQWQNPASPYKMDTQGLGQEWGGYSSLSSIGNAGTGAFNSPLMGSYENKVQGMLENPNAGIAMGLARDRIEGNLPAARQAINDSMAGWGRGSGVGLERQDALTGQLAQQKANAFRDIGLQTQQDALSAAQSLTGLQSSNYANQQGREMQNAQFNVQASQQEADRSLQAYEAAKQRALSATGVEAQMYTNEANRALQSFQDAQQRIQNNQAMGASSFENAQGRIQNNQAMGMGAYESAMGRELQNAGLGQSAYESSMDRQLQNAGLSSGAYSDAQNRALQNAGLTQGYNNANLGNLSNMLQWAGSQGSANDQNAFNNTLQASTYNTDQQRYQDMINEQNRMAQMQGFNPMQGGGMNTGGMGAYNPQMMGMMQQQPSQNMFDMIGGMRPGNSRGSGGLMPDNPMDAWQRQQAMNWQKNQLLGGPYQPQIR